ncbi:MAG: hypothetical protein IJX19_11290 [Clostridia bacterium]|nr:hypothetical protein [Clostridia bacterium]
MKKAGIFRIFTVILAILMTLSAFISCNSISSLFGNQTASGNSSEADENDVATVRYGTTGHFPYAVTKNEYNAKGQLLSVTSLDIYTLLPDYENVLYHTNRRFVYDGGQLSALYYQGKKATITYDSTSNSYQGSCQYDENDLIDITLYFGDNGLLVKEIYLVNGEPLRVFEYDEQGRISKETMGSGYRIDHVYTEDGNMISNLYGGDSLSQSYTFVIEDEKIVAVKDKIEQSVMMTYTYNDKGLCTFARLDEATYYETTYDEKGLPASMNGKTETQEQQRSYEYNDDGEIVKLVVTRRTLDSYPYFSHSRTTLLFEYDEEKGLAKLTVTKETIDKNGTVTNTSVSTYE